MIHRRTFLLSTAAAAATSGVKVTTVYKSPGPAPNGLQATADGLWVLDQKENVAYLIAYADGKVIRRLTTDSKAGSGITFDGEAIWIASTYSREILRADAKTGATLARFPSPGAGPVSWKPEEARRSPLTPPPPPRPANPGPPSPRQATGAHGLEWRDGKLYISNPPSRKVYRVNPKSFEIEFEFATVGNRPHGLGWDGDYLWCADSNLNGFHKHDPKTGKVLDSIILSDADPQPHGATIWNGEMWYCDEAGVICKFRLR